MKLCFKPIKSVFGIYNHYFLLIEEIDMEIHPGHYKYGVYMRAGSTKGYSVESNVMLCPLCLNGLINLVRTLEEVWFYPYINCETLSKGLTIGKKAISNQLVLTVFILQSYILLIFERCLPTVYKVITFIIISIVVLLFVMINMCPRRLLETKFAACEHVESHQVLRSF